MDLVFDQGAVLFGDCVERLKELPDNCIDSIVTDPPYNLSDTSKRDGYCQGGCFAGRSPRGLSAVFSGCSARRLFGPSVLWI